MTTGNRTKKELLAENEILRLRLEEAEETLRAIGSGGVDAFVITSPEGKQQVFTLKGAEQPYRILVESINEGAAILAADGAILYCNKRLSTMLQIPLERLIGTKLGAHVAPKDFHTFTALFESCVQESLSEEIAMTTMAGGSIPVLLSCCANETSGAQGISVVVTDLTQQRRNEEILASEHFSTSIVEQASDAIVVCDVKGKIIRASQLAHSLCGTNPLLKPFAKMFRLRIKESGALFSLLPHMQVNRFSSIEVEFKRNDGKLFSLLLNATHLKNIRNQNNGSIVTLADITERKLTEQALQQSEIRLQSAYSHLQFVNEELQIAYEELQMQSEALQNQNQELEQLWERSKRSEEAISKSEERLALATSATQVGIFDWDVATGKVFWTQTHESIFGYAPTTAITTASTAITQHDRSRWSDRVHPEDLPLIEEESRRCMQDCTPVDFKYRIIWPDGSLHWIESKGVFLYDGNGHAIRMLGIAIDITERKRIEEALNESESRFRTMANAIPQLAWIARADGHIFWYNQRWYEYTGTTPEQMEGWGWQSVHDPSELARVLERWQTSIATGEPFEMTFPLRGADGDFRPFLTRIIPLKDAAGRVQQWFGTNTDINELKLVELSLRESEERHRVLAETMLQGVVHHDSNGTIITMNPSAERILGKGLENFLGNSSVDVEENTIHENGEKFPGMEHPAMVALRTGITVRGVIMGVFNPKMDEYRWISIDAVPVFHPGETAPSEVFTVFEDITERRQVEKALQASEQRIQQALRVSRSFTFDWLPDTDHVQRSASCGEILNLTGDEALNDTGEHFIQQIHPDDRVGFLDILHKLTPANSSYVTEYRVIRNDGSEIMLEEVGHGTFYNSGTLERLVGVTTDITIRKQAEQELQKAHDELEQRVHERTKDLANSIERLHNEIEDRERAETSLLHETVERLQAVEALREKEQMLIHQSRQAAMGEMIGNIAHQWRQPLNSLGLIVQHLPLKYELGEFTKEFLSNSVGQSMQLVQHMSKTIDDFRNFFRPDREKVEFRVNETISTTLKLIEDSFISQHIKIEVLDKESTVLYGYRNEFAQALLNILNNARDALTERKTEKPRVTITSRSKNGSAVVTISDNAGGIPKEILNKIFEPYFTTKGPQAGTGIGLFMSKTIIEKNMGGTLTVRNTAEGAEFRIEV
ncbi:MAG: PAS domain S-box protein [Desulfuromonadales bacterium]|nr:PAS domain S-box protein [Desulfuromonadales bacterium]